MIKGETGMKKYKKRNLIIITVICIPIILFIISYCNYRINNVKNSCSDEVNKYIQDISNQNGEIYLYDYLNFKCDGFYVIGPYTTSNYKHEIVGERWYHYSSYGSYLFNELLLSGDTTDEIYQELVFVKDNKVLSVATTERKKGDFTGLDERYYSIDQLFTNVGSDGNWNYIIEGIKK